MFAARLWLLWGRNGIRAGVRSAPLEIGFLLGKERLVAEGEILRAEACKALVVLLLPQGPRIGQAPGELLMPTGDQRRSFGNPPRRCERFFFDLVIGNNARDQPFFLGFVRPEN